MLSSTRDLLVNASASANKERNAGDDQGIYKAKWLMEWLPIANYTDVKGVAGLIMVDICYTTLHKETGEGV